MRKTLIQIALLCIVGCGLISCVWSRRVVSLQDGRTLEEKGDYIGAMAHYKRMPNPGFRDVSIHNLQHLYGDILKTMIAQRNNPNSAESYYELGKAYYEKALSIPEYHEIVPNQGFDSSTYFSEQRDRFHAQAHTTLESATQSRAGYQDALLLEGNLYEDMGEPEKAIAKYQQVVDLVKEKPDEDRKEPEMTISTYQQPVDIDTRSSEAFYKLSMLLYDQGQTEEGLELAKQAITLSPDNPDVHFTLGMLFAREENDEQAISEFHQALCLDPNFMDAYYSIAQLFLREGNSLDAERILRLGFSNNPENLRLSLLYRSLKSVLDSKEIDEFASIYEALYGEVVNRLLLDALKDEDFEPSPDLKIRYLHLIQKIIERDQPYVFPCAGMKEHPYFKTQIARIQEEIEELEQTIQAAKEAAKEASPNEE